MGMASADKRDQPLRAGPRRGWYEHSLRAGSLSARRATACAGSAAAAGVVAGFAAGTAVAEALGLEMRFVPKES